MENIYRINVNKKYNIKNLPKCIELINSNYEKFINEGTQGKVYKVESDNCGSAVVKKKIIKGNEIISKSKFEKECKISMLSTRMIKALICPNFIESYYYSINDLILIMEYADGDSRFLFENKFYDTIIYETYIIQSLIGLFSFNNYTLLNHKDMKPANILYKNIDNRFIFHYRINEYDYWIPSNGYLFMITDFGNCSFTLDGEINDLEYFKYKMIKSLMRIFITINSKFKYKYENFYNNFEKLTIYLKYKKIDNKTLNIINNFINDFEMTDCNINKIIIKLINTLNNDNILDILNLYFNKYTKNTYDEKNIIHFNIHF